MPQHFLDRFSFSILQFAQEQKLIDPTDKILVSVSGGVDSVCLLIVLNAFRIKIDLELHLVHFHHGLRAESDEEADFVKDLGNSLALPVTIRKTSELKGSRGMQNKARIWRFQQLESLMTELNANKIALGHHLDDLVETQLWRLMRGCSLFSLNPIQVRHLPYIRPLLHTPKSALVNYLNSIGQPWREDDSNQTTDYTRNLIRHKIIPIMDECAGGKLSEKLLGIDTDARHLREHFDECVPASCYEQTELDYHTVSSLNPLLGHELIHRFLIFHEQGEVTRVHIEKIYGLILSGKGNWTVNLKEGISVRGDKKKVKLIKLP